MTYIPSHLASIKLDELRRQADLERRGRQVTGATRAAKPARARPTRRTPFELPLLLVRRTVSQG